MPSWDTALSEQQRWKVTAFLSHLGKLPPAVRDYWKQAYGVAPQPAAMDMKDMDGTGKGSSENH
jgi:hypothetical protein